MDSSQGPDSLGRIATALERLVELAEAMLEALTAPTVEGEEVDGPCVHPADQRVDFGVTKTAAGMVADWQCRACGYRSVSDE